MIPSPFLTQSQFGRAFATSDDHIQRLLKQYSGLGYTKDLILKALKNCNYKEQFLLDEIF